MIHLRKGISACILALVVGWPQAHAQHKVQGEAIAEARRIAQSWNVTSVRIVDVEGDSIETKSDSSIHVGARFSEKWTTGLDLPAARSALIFIFLHEIWHTRQILLFPDRFAQPRLRPIVECQADMMATQAYARDLALGPMAGTSLLKSKGLFDFRSAWAAIVKLTGQVAVDHLTGPQRALAMQLGVMRGLAEAAAIAPTDRDPFEAAILSAFFIDGSKDIIDWSWETCERIIGREDAALTLRWHDPELLEDGDGSLLNNWAKFGISVTNPTSRPVRLSLTALAGTHPKGKEDLVELFTLTGISTHAIELAPGQSATIQGRLRVNPNKLSDEEWFLWTAPPIDDALVAVHFLEVPPATSCSQRWHLDPLQPSDAQLAAITQLTEGLKTGFKDQLGPVWAVVSDYTIYSPKYPIPGATDTRLYPVHRLTEPPFALVTIEARSEGEALIRFRKSVALLKQHCDAVTGEWKETTQFDGTPAFEVKHFTPTSRAKLTVRKSGKKGPAGEPLFVVVWRLDPRQED